MTHIDDDRDVITQSPADSEPRPCVFPGCVSTDRHSHGGFPGGYANPDDPDGPPIEFTTEPEPGVRDYNGALLPPADSEGSAEHRRERLYVIEAVRQFIQGDPLGGGAERVLKFLDGIEFGETGIDRRSVRAASPVAESGLRAFVQMISDDPCEATAFYVPDSLPAEALNDGVSRCLDPEFNEMRDEETGEPISPDELGMCNPCAARAALAAAAVVEPSGSTHAPPAAPTNDLSTDANLVDGAPPAAGLDLGRLVRAIEIEDDRLPFLDAGIDSTASPRAVAEQIADRYAVLDSGLVPLRPMRAAAAPPAAPRVSILDSDPAALEGNEGWFDECAPPAAELDVHDPVPVCDRCHQLIVMDDDGDWWHEAEYARLYAGADRVDGEPAP